ncbi:hypothetical protein SAXI111661_06170 [Saccharomonospora xinjiangensis]|uniref:hypothetical protein n=1 Tax=Saccharomonospora xinjiangensis TaxID=75294 RepID=UPI00106FBA65|nr:hypothetical protein [Saccharomonospora xinjiangensis]QBQ58711.1 hypothetical protein EYD13_01620 [Saccharomonospora xinjiangensis]
MPSTGQAEQTQARMARSSEQAEVAACAMTRTSGLLPVLGAGRGGPVARRRGRDAVATALREDRS